MLTCNLTSGSSNRHVQPPLFCQETDLSTRIRTNKREDNNFFLSSLKTINGVHLYSSIMTVEIHSDCFNLKYIHTNFSCKTIHIKIFIKYKMSKTFKILMLRFQSLRGSFVSFVGIYLLNYMNPDRSLLFLTTFKNSIFCYFQSQFFGQQASRNTSIYSTLFI